MDGALWLKAVHIVAFAAWMAGMWYLPRLFVYHSGVAAGSEASDLFKVMERRLLSVIIRPALLVTVLIGVVLATLQGQWVDGWLHLKLLLVLGMLAAHVVLERDVASFGRDQRPRSARWYRMFNEVPTLLFVGIVILAVIKPWS